MIAKTESERANIAARSELLGASDKRTRLLILIRLTERGHRLEVATLELFGREEYMRGVQDGMAAEVAP